MVNTATQKTVWEKQIRTVALATGDGYLTAASKVYHPDIFNPLESFFTHQELKYVKSFLNTNPVGLLLVVGEKGSGKTRLLNFMMKHLTENNIPITVIEQIREINLKLWLKDVSERSLGAKNSFTIKDLYLTLLRKDTTIVVQSENDEIFENNFLVKGSRIDKTLTPVRLNPHNLPYIFRQFFYTTNFGPNHFDIVIQQQQVIVKETGLPYVMHAVIPCVPKIITHLNKNEIPEATQILNQMGLQTLQQKVDALVEKDIIEI